MTDGWSIAGVVLGGVGAASGVVSLIWQTITRRRLAHRVVVEGRIKTEDGKSQLSAIARNLGAAPVTLESWGVVTARREPLIEQTTNHIPLQVAQGRSMIARFIASEPTELNAGAKDQRWVSLSEVLKEAEREYAEAAVDRPFQRPAAVRVYFALATGKRHYSKKIDIRDRA